MVYPLQEVASPLPPSAYQSPVFVVLEVTSRSRLRLDYTWWVTREKNKSFCQRFTIKQSQIKESTNITQV